MHRSSGNVRSDERGYALLLALIFSIWMMLLCLSMIFVSTTDFSISHDLGSKIKALATVDAGYNVHRDLLRGNDLNTILQNITTVPQYINYTQPAPGTDAFTFFSRNPLAPIEIMNVDYDNPPIPIGTRTVAGLLTPPSGQLLGSGGRYWAKITDNNDGDNDLSSDEDGKIYLRVMGIQRSAPGQISTYGGTAKNSVTITEATLKRDTTFDFSSPFTVYGPDVNAIFNGNSFDLDGNPHDLNGNPIAGTPVAGLSVFYDNSEGGDAEAAVASVTGALSGGQANRIVGAGPSPSIQDNTDDIRYDPDPDKRNIFDPNWIMNLLNRMGSIADNNLTQYQYSSIGAGAWGTQANPQITVRNGNLKVTGSGSGAGLLVVTGTLEIGGAFDFDGLILVLGGDLWLHGANKSIVGGIFTANVIDNWNGTYSYGEPAIRLSGDSNVLYSGDGLAMGYSLLPMKQLAWREITPEIEP
ncbi:hypothetical protein MYX82_09015 [Acidobacteria bacterium AH-259-D05]|nr:hypothetical protein [Acidobacteria bacterium AH-259-D05]